MRLLYLRVAVVVAVVDLWEVVEDKEEPRPAAAAAERRTTRQFDCCRRGSHDGLRNTDSVVMMT